MATYTPNLNLKKPSTSENYDVVADLNDSKDKIDNSIGNIVKSIASIVVIAREMQSLSDNTAYVDSLIDSMPEGSTLHFPIGEYIYNGSKLIQKSIKLKGNGTVLKTTEANHNVFFSFANAHHISIEGIRFDNNLLGRTVLDFSTCENISVKMCYFTGYSAEFGHHGTDSAIRVSGAKNVMITENTFENFGGQYGTDISTLNRCITVNDEFCENVHIKSNTFKNVNQAIVNAGIDVIIADNIFEEVKDNVVYMVQASKNMVITGNYIKVNTDECFVISGSNIVISNNIALEVYNKFVAVNGNCDNVIISGNMLRNTASVSGQFIIYRDVTYTINKLTVTGNQFSNTIDNFGYRYFEFGNVIDLIMSDNNIDVVTIADQRVFSFQGVTARGRIFNNIITVDNATTVVAVMNSSVTDYEMYFENNHMFAGRVGSVDKFIIKGQILQTNVGPYGKQLNNFTEVYANAPPTTGAWSVGDVVYSLVPSAGSYIGWVCITAGTPGTWKGFGAIQA